MLSTTSCQLVDAFRPDSQLKLDEWWMDEWFDSADECGELCQVSIALNYGFGPPDVHGDDDDDGEVTFVFFKKISFLYLLILPLCAIMVSLMSTLMLYGDDWFNQPPTAHHQISRNSPVKQSSQLVVPPFFALLPSIPSLKNIFPSFRHNLRLHRRCYVVIVTMTVWVYCVAPSSMISHQCDHNFSREKELWGHHNDKALSTPRLSRILTTLAYLVRHRRCWCRFAFSVSPLPLTPPQRSKPLKKVGFTDRSY